MLNSMDVPGARLGLLPAMKVKKWAPAFDDIFERSGGVARRRESDAVFGGDVVTAWKLSTPDGNVMSRRQSRATKALTLCRIEA
jgi:hypothetical protein